MSPLLFIERLQLSPHLFSLVLLLYGVAYLSGGIIAQILSTRILASTQIVVGLLLIFVAGIMMLLLMSVVGPSVPSLLLPMIVCTTGTTITRPIATSKAMDIFPTLAGTAASTGGMLVFICGGVISALINLSHADLQLTLAVSFIGLSLSALALNALIGREPHSLGPPAV